MFASSTSNDETYFTDDGCSVNNHIPKQKATNYTFNKCFRYFQQRQLKSSNTLVLLPFICFIVVIILIAVHIIRISSNINTASPADVQTPFIRYANTINYLFFSNDKKCDAFEMSQLADNDPLNIHHSYDFNIPCIAFQYLSKVFPVSNILSIAPTANIQTNHSFIFGDRSFSNYASFDDVQYHSIVQNIMDKGMYDLIRSLTQWVQNLREEKYSDIQSFYAEWQYQYLNIEQMISEYLLNVGNRTKSQAMADVSVFLDVMELMRSQISFANKEFMYFIINLLFYSNRNDFKNALGITFNFANEDFILYTQEIYEDFYGEIMKSMVNGKLENGKNSLGEILKLSNIQSFGAGIGFGVQIYCDSRLIFETGGGGGGGYNSNDSSSKKWKMNFGGGGGIQILVNDSVSVDIGGGMGYEHENKLNVDLNANPRVFYSQVPGFLDLMRNKSECRSIRVVSGGGSGGGFTTVGHNPMIQQMQSDLSNLFGWSYFSLNFTL